ncbi:MAG: short-chain dehydrogenase [Burkholderiales bacterium PBB3]|nr:MAG: short-chain dehydrogenase [Burkholderiales bacterium PBB3]
MLHLTVLTGASRGLGAALADQLLQADTRLLCISRGSSASLAAKATALASRAGLAETLLLEQWTLDLADSAPVAQQLAAWLARQASPQLASATLINNAAVIPAVTPLAAAQSLELAQALRVGLEAPMQLTAAFLAATANWNCSRKVLNISSGLGRYAMASQAAYCAAKAGMDHFSRCVALEEAQHSHGAKICSLAPGVIDTDMQLQLRNTPATDFADVARFQALHAQGQLASPADTAAKILAYLARPDFGNETVADIRSV